MQNGGVIDLRSDTATKPTPEMRAAMAAAEVGDEQLREDPTVNELQARAGSFIYEAWTAQRSNPSPAPKEAQTPSSPRMGGG